MLTVLLQCLLLAGGAAWCYDAGAASSGAGVAAFRAALVLLACGAMGVVQVGVLRRQWAVPLDELSRAVERLRGGDWQARIHPRGDGAAADIGFRLNLLAEQTQTQLSDLRRQRNDLIDLIDSLPDPVVLADAQHRVAQLNAPAAVLLSITPRQAAGQKLVSVLGESSLVELCEQLLASDSTGLLIREINVTRLGQKLTYQAVTARTSDGGLLLTLRDITRLTATVQMKTDFVANASHELRTPITAIKIAFDTLAEVYTEDLTQTARCLEIIAGHMKRLEDMLQDLLDLSRVENEEVKPEWADVRAADVLAAVRQATGALAEAKGVVLETIDDCTGPFISERRLLDLMLKNLVENAVKFTSPGGRVTVMLGKQPDGGIVISVADTGIGIPPQHLDRVFERFYQVDAARSGTSGRGTGLGLAIVKHAAAGLGGQVTLDSTVGRGTTVTCVLPGKTAD